MNPLISTLLLSALIFSANAGTVAPGDPSPGGIGYHWTATLGGRDQVSFEGSVGAWSWDDGGSASPSGQGWTHTSDWVALELATDCRLTLRLEARDAGTGTGADLDPAFTLYRHWQESGGDSHTYANRGDVSWAPELTYLVHFETSPGRRSLEGTVRLPAGRYTLALGGNSKAAGSPTAPQDFTATLSTRPSHDPVSLLLARTQFSTSRPVVALSGRVRHPDSLAEIRARLRGRTLPVRVAGPRWTVRVSGLKPGPNRVVLSARSLDGTASPTRTTTIHRILPVGRPSPAFSRLGTGPFAP